MTKAQTAGTATLDRLPAGTAATVRGITVTPRGDASATCSGGTTRRRLLELGFTPGTRVAVLCRAPGGDPAIYALRGYRITLRAVLARLVLTDTPTVGRDS